MKRLFRRRFQYSICVLMCLMVPVHACLNDRDSDSLADEAQDLPDVVQVIVGRFPRNPPLFYQMRIARVQQELRSNPRKFNLYDDISVALDRLGRDDEALSWIEKKRAWLPPFNAKNRVLKEQWYRYYANNGTFWAHRWLRNGANRKRISEMMRARDHIARAIQIKPNAHFGREKYQLMAMNWIIKPQTEGSGSYIPTFITSSVHDENEAIKGLSGLVVLGNAWESVDVFNALKVELQKSSHTPLGLLAQLRCQELIDGGKSSLLPAAISRGLEEQRYMVTKSGRHVADMSAADKKEVAAAYKTLRAEAETWQHARTSYMMSRLKQGRHPDTDKTFWIEYSNSAPPSLEQLTPRISPRWWREITGNFMYRVTLFWLTILAGPFLLIKLLRKVVKNYKKRNAPQHSI